MVEVVKNNIGKIRETCKKMGVKSLYLFGSATRPETFGADSDIDFLIQFKLTKEGLHSTSFDYLDVLFALEQITGRNVDLIAEERITNRYFKESVEKSKQAVYES